MIENDKRHDMRVYKPKKRNNRTFSRILAFLGVFAVCFTLLLPTFNHNNVSASSTFFIESSDYNISLGGLFTAETTYELDEPYKAITPLGDHFITIVKNSNSDYSLQLNYTMTTSTNQTQLGTVSLTKSINSQRYKFTSNRSFNMTYIGLQYGANDYIINEPYFANVNFTSMEVNIPIKYATDVDNMFNNLNCCRYLFYKSSNNQFKLNIVYANSMTTFDSDPVMSVYFTFTDDYPESVSSQFLYNNQVVRIDRSYYIDKEVVYENPFDNLLVSISNGITNFMSIEIFPNFSFGTIVSLVLGIALFTLLLHLIIK